MDRCASTAATDHPVFDFRGIHHSDRLPAHFSLEGIEGKMFKPMALTVSYALIGALLAFIDLCARGLGAVPEPEDQPEAPAFADRLILSGTAICRC
jgi:hypothetical protein